MVSAPVVGLPVRTFSGLRLDLTQIQPEQISVHDLAHHLALLPRFCGATPMPISIAQHSYWVSWLCGDDAAGRQGLVHDGSEYLLNDLNKWLKSDARLSGYRDLEDRLQRTIYEAFGCQLAMLPEVREADTLMVRVEAEWAWGADWSDVPGYGPLTPEDRARVPGWRPWTWKEAERNFLHRYRRLWKGVA